MRFLNFVAMAIGKTARVIHPPKPPRTYAETPEVVEARLHYEQTKKALDEQTERNRRELADAIKNLEIERAKTRK